MDTTNDLTPRAIVRLGIKYGLYAFIAYTVYFLIMRMAGLATIIELRFLNYVFLMFAAYFAMKKAESAKKTRIKYLQAMVVTFMTGLFSFLYFCLFIFFYSIFDNIIINTFFELFSGSQAFGRFGVPVLIASEGIAISAVIALLMGFVFQAMTVKQPHQDYIHQGLQ